MIVYGVWSSEPWEPSFLMGLYRNKEQAVSAQRTEETREGRDTLRYYSTREHTLHE